MLFFPKIRQAFRDGYISFRLVNPKEVYYIPSEVTLHYQNDYPFTKHPILWIFWNFGFQSGIERHCHFIWDY